jgi:transketolase
MRTAFIQEFIAQARLNPTLFLVVGDLGYSVVEPFAQEFPDRFLNAGVAEQNMTGVAAGLASEGYHVFTYSIANFPTLRCLEQIRNDICYHGFPVTIVSVGAGMSYGNLGYSHHAVQDIAILRSLPGISVLSPADPGETKASVRWLSANPRPSYLRIGKAGEPNLHASSEDIDSPIQIRSGNPSIGLVATGSILKMALDLFANYPLENSPTIFSMPMVKPVLHSAIKSLSRFRHIIALEEHISEGGLFAALSENLPPTICIHQCSINDETTQLVGSQGWLIEKNELYQKAALIFKSLQEKT